jgi:phospholipid/cholesterol/gamma-HCH transport system substrate-binding protein
VSISASQRARLGAFMTVGALLMAVFVAIPIGFRLVNKQKDYHSFFLGESISGLEQGAVVKFRGVPVGKVVKITYDPKDLLRVRVDMKLDHDFPLKADMYAQMGGINITGIKHVELNGGTNESALLKAGSEIPSRVSMMTNITGKAEVIIAKMELLIDHLNGLTDPDSSMGQILNNVATITGEARGFIAEVRPQFAGSSRSMANVLARVDSISRDVRSIVEQTRKSMSAERVTRIMTSVDSSAMSIKRVADDVSMVVRQSREDIMVSMQNLREALENANELTKVLAENPSLLLRTEQQKERNLP